MDVYSSVSIATDKQNMFTKEHMMSLVQYLQETEIPKPTCRNADQAAMRNRVEVAWRIWASLSQKAMAIVRLDPSESANKLVKPAEFRGLELMT